MKRFYFILLFFVCAQLNAFSLKEKVNNSQPGDYIVAEQSKSFSLLFIKSLDNQKLVLEEISAPDSMQSSASKSWQQWIDKGAPGNTSWTTYTLDLSKNKLLNCYSHTKKGWLHTDSQDSFLTQLFILPLTKVKDADRRRIGPPPAQDQTDRRALWNPPLIVAGKKIDKPLLDVYQTKWGSDDTQLSGCAIELYFDAARPEFLFPCWIEIKSPHYAHKIRIIDSGIGLISSTKLQ